MAPGDARSVSRVDRAPAAAASPRLAAPLHAAPASAHHKEPVPLVLPFGIDDLLDRGGIPVGTHEEGGLRETTVQIHT